MPVHTLFVTVGGSPQPIVTAVRQHRPRRVVFVCSDDDETTGRSGSYTQVTGAGKVCSSHPGVAADLPNLATQSELPPEAVEVLKVPADGPGAAIEILGTRLRAAIEEAAGDAVVADYTGGTKSMSAALFLVAMQHPEVELSLIGGLRSDLVRVVDGSQNTVRIDAAQTRRSWRLVEARRAWSRHAYGEASRLLSAEQSSAPEIVRVLNLSRGYAAWDAFDHARAYGLLQPLGKHVPGGLMSALAGMRAPDWAGPDQEISQSDQARQRKVARKAESLRIWDLRLMADRRASAGHYDTGVLLLYRVLEWIGQWTLRFDHDVSTDDVPADLGALDGLGFTGHDARRKLGLHEAWMAVARLDGPLADSAARTERTRLEFLQRRNQSLYAHGRTPIAEVDFNTARRWLDAEILPAFLEHAFRGRPPFDQLPTAP